jgi:hypothetical protein
VYSEHYNKTLTFKEKEGILKTGGKNWLIYREHL